MDRRDPWVMCSRTILHEVRCWPEAAPIRAECRRNQPVVKFWSTLLPSQEFTVDCIATFLVIHKVDSVSAIHRKGSRDLVPPAAQGGWVSRDPFDEYANSVTEIERSCLAL